MAKARKTDSDVETAIETFCEALMCGHKQRDAYVLCHPACKTQNKRALDVRACEFAHRPDVQERLAELRKDAQERHKQFQDQLIDMLQEEISTCYHDNKTLSPVMKQVDVAVRVLGMDKQVIDVKADVGAFDREQVADKLNFLIGKAKKGAKK